MERKNAWLKYTEEQVQSVFDFCQGYRTFISNCKTERECVAQVISEAKALGYQDLKEVIANQTTLKAGDRVYYDQMGKSLLLFLVGTKPLENGLRILGAHVDSPRLDVKQIPLYEDNELVLLDTHYYGGIKKYQWVTLPLAIHGVVAKKDGTIVNIVIGEDENDPVVGISDLLIHLASTQMDKKANKVIEGEDLNVLIGSRPLKDDEKTKEEKDVSDKDKKEKKDEKVKAYILQILKEKYSIDEADFLSAELEIVTAGKARDYGIDRSMVIGYGQDDRVCAYTSVQALFQMQQCERTCACVLSDKEEIGSVGASGMKSRFFENAVAELMDRTGNYSELKLRRALTNSSMLSSDVTAAYDPNYPAVSEKKNTAYFGNGVVFAKYTGSRGKSGSNDANAEFVAKLRAIMDKHEVSFQTSELGKVDEGGGGTIAYILAEYGMNVIDCGVAVQNMHAPWEVTSKADIYEAFCCYLAFLKEA